MKEEVTLRLIAYLEGDLSPEEHAQVDEDLNNDPKLIAELERLKRINQIFESEDEIAAPPEVDARFHEMIAQERSKNNNNSLNIIWKVAAGLLLIISGIWIGKTIDTNSRDQELTALKEEIQANRDLILSLSQASAHERFKAVSASQELSAPDPNVLDALIKVLKNDDNINVRVAAVRSLERFAYLEVVKKQLLEALGTVEDPLLQIILINVLVELEDERLLPKLNELIESETTPEEVKDEAHWGVIKLTEV